MIDGSDSVAVNWYSSMDVPARRKVLWLGQSHSNASTYGWRIFKDAGQFGRNTESDLDRITLFDDGTWKYGIWENE